MHSGMPGVSPSLRWRSVAGPTVSGLEAEGRLLHWDMSKTLRVVKTWTLHIAPRICLKSLFTFRSQFVFPELALLHHREQFTSSFALISPLSSWQEMAVHSLFIFFLISCWHNSQWLFSPHLSPRPSPFFFLSTYPVVLCYCFEVIEMLNMKFAFIFLRKRLVGFSQLYLKKEQQKNPQIKTKEEIQAFFLILYTPTELYFLFCWAVALSAFSQVCFLSFFSPRWL